MARARCCREWAAVEYAEVAQQLQVEQVRGHADTVVLFAPCLYKPHACLGEQQQQRTNMQ